MKKTITFGILVLSIFLMGCEQPPPIDEGHSEEDGIPKMEEQILFLYLGEICMDIFKQDYGIHERISCVALDKHGRCECVYAIKTQDRIIEEHNNSYVIVQEEGYKTEIIQFVIKEGVLD